jgi:alkaline phosphatase
MSRYLLAVVLLLPAVLSAQAARARNVVLFVADAGGIPTLHAASWHGYSAPRKLFVQRMPHIGLSDTTPARALVSDSAAGMTAIVTGESTLNGVIAQSATAVRGKTDGAPLKTILEYAEEHGLSTGIITNDALTGATPAALYAKANDRGQTAVIFQQAFAARYGDGPDVMIGAGRAAIAKALTAAGIDLDALGREQGRPVLRTLDEVAPDATRALVVLESAEFDLEEAMRLARRMLSANPRGYFLMVEWDTHTNNVRRGLDRMVALDRAIERTAQTAGDDTLLLFTADHSFDLRIRGGDVSQPLLDGLEAEQALAAEEKRSDIQIRALRMNNTHTGEEVLVAAQGPGADRVRGYLANTDLFDIMMRAFGWTED